MRFETKIAVIVRDDLPTWQRLNMTAFLVSGIAATIAETIGEPYIDGSDRQYLPMFRQPVLVFAASAAAIRDAYERASSRELPMAIFTDELFGTGHDEANRAAVRPVPSEQLALAGLSLYGPKKAVDAATKGLTLHP